MKYVTVAVATFLSLLLTGCSIIDARQARAQVAEIRELAKVGDNIYQARTRLEARGFRPGTVTFGSIEKKSHVFTVQVTNYTQLDWLGYAAETNLTPWRNGIPYHVVIRSKLDEVINKIEVK